MEPKFKKNQVVWIVNLIDGHGQPTNPFAAKYKSYFAKIGVVVDSRPYVMGKESILLYRVKMDDDRNHWMRREPATIIEVPENCLMEVKEFIR